MTKQIKYKFWKDNLTSGEYQEDVSAIKIHIKDWMESNKRLWENWPFQRWWPMAVIGLGTWENKDDEPLSDLVREVREEFEV